MEYNDKNLLDLFAQGLSYSRIAIELNVTIGQVSGRLKRIRRKDPTLAPSRHVVRAQKIVEKKTQVVVKQKPNWLTVQSRPRGYTQLSKAALRAMLKQAVENTK